MQGECHKAKKLINGSELQYLIRSVVGSGPAYIWIGQRFKPSDCDFESIIGPHPIPNDSNTAIKVTGDWIKDITGGNPELGAVLVEALTGGTIFGGLHCLAWNFHFPTPGEVLGWRICSVATTVLPILSLIPVTMWLNLNPYKGLKDLEQHSKLVGGRAQLGQLQQLLREVSEQVNQLGLPNQQERLNQLEQFRWLWLQGQRERFKQLERLEPGMPYTILLRERFRQEKRLEKFKEEEQEWFDQLEQFKRFETLERLEQAARELIEWIKRKRIDQIDLLDRFERKSTESIDKLIEKRDEHIYEYDSGRQHSRYQRVINQVQAEIDREQIKLFPQDLFDQDRFELEQLEQIKREWIELEMVERYNQKELERYEQKLREEQRERGWFEQKGREEHLEQDSRNKEPVWLKVVVAFICIGGVFIPYILARLFLWVEVFRTLYFLPPDAFVDTWSGSFPHIG